MPAPSCPRCGNSVAKTIAPGVHQCTYWWNVQVPTGAHPSGAQGPAYYVVTNECLEVFRTTVDLGGSSCSLCNAGAVTRCPQCDRKVCWQHLSVARFEARCSQCRHQQDEQARVRAAEQHRAAAEQAAALARAEAEAHDATVAERRMRFGSDASIRSRIASENRRARPPRWTPGLGTGFALWLVVEMICYYAAKSGQPPGYSPSTQVFVTGIAVSVVLWVAVRAALAVWSFTDGRSAQRVNEWTSQLGCGTTRCGRCEEARG